MALVDIEASAFLIGKESLNAKATPIITTSQISIRYVGHRENRLVMAACPPNDGMQCDFACLGKPNFIPMKHLALFHGVVAEWLVGWSRLHINLRRSA
jgi:hypothetical protein